MKKDVKGKKGNSHIFDLQVAKELILFVGEYRDNQDSAMKCLEIAKRLKDVYLSAFNSRFQSPNADLPVAEELTLLQEQTTLEFLEFIKNNGSTCASAESSSQTPKASKEQSNIKAEGNVELVCFYCSATNVEQTEDSFFIHPYVPVNYERSPLLMCVHCLENWKAFREEASKVNELILPGENNEEICCLCSDCPKKLTLCGSCQRSFCLNCVKKVLTPTEYKTMISEKGRENDWKCMCCSNQTSVHPPLGRDAWRLWNSSPDKTAVASSSSSLTGKKSPSKQSKNSKNNIPTPQKANSVVESVFPSVASSGRKRKAISQSSETSVKDEPNNSSSKQKKRRKNEDEELEEKDEDSSTKQKDYANKSKNEKPDQSVACFYFQDYCLDLNQSYRSIIQSLNSHSTSSEEELTEDVCFLCKDGGNLVGCDYCSPSAASSQSIEPNQRCSKVYHQDCLGFKIPRGVNYWCCPKHFCSSCGGKELQFMCLFCPISLCKECPSKLPQKVSY
jgi:hypothetical protein